MTNDGLDVLRAQIVQLLAHEKRAMHTGDIAVRLQLATHQVHSALHLPMMRLEVGFSSSEGYRLLVAEKRPSMDDGTQRSLG